LDFVSKFTDDDKIVDKNDAKGNAPIERHSVGIGYHDIHL